MPRAWTLGARPQGTPTLSDFALVEQPPAALEAGQIRVANRWLSVDPYMRGRMNDVKSYVPPFQIGAAMDGGAVGVIVESRADGLAPGTTVLHMRGWRDEAVLAAGEAQVLPPVDAPPQAFLGQLGIPGMTAWFGLFDIASAKAGDVVFVSAAAGAVGSTVVQIAKAKGMRVIGSAGGAEKTAWVRDLGADAVIDYKAAPVIRALSEAAPEGIDVYFDNVGGDHLDAALAHARNRARFAICGMIDGYNDAKPAALKYLARLIGNRIQMRGFIVTDHLARAGEFHQGMAALLAEGKLQSRETIREGLEAMPGAFLELFSGGNIGKMLVRL